MVRLSPKALRFAEDAARGLIDNGWPKEVWEIWSADRRARSSKSVRASEGYVDVPDAVAEILFFAVERRIGQMEARLERDDDADLGNDIAFLRAVSGTLRTELRQAPEVRL